VDGALFPRNAEVTPIPNYFFSHVLPEIKDPDELRVVLHIFFAIRCKTVFPRFVSHSELLSDEGLLRSFGTRHDPDSAVNQATRAALRRGLLVGVLVTASENPAPKSVGAGLRPAPDAGERSDEILYFINDDAGRRAAHRVEAGELAVSVPLTRSPAAPAPEPESLIQLYEANFGPLTPLIAESIAEARTRYPEEWLPRAMKKAVAANVRRWNYVEAILERWQNEGSDVDEETGRDPEAERLWQRYVRAKGWPQ
jgi:DNA replication protein